MLYYAFGRTRLHNNAVSFMANIESKRDGGTSSGIIVRIHHIQIVCHSYLLTTRGNDFIRLGYKNVIVARYKALCIAVVPHTSEESSRDGACMFAFSISFHGLRFECYPNPGDVMTIVLTREQ